jgi:hypothetical protein
MKIFAIALLLASGCGVQIDTSRKAEAAYLVWSSYAEESTAPDAIFIEQARLNCAQGKFTGRMYGFIESVSLNVVGSEGHCLSGQFFFGERTAQVALRDGDNYSTTSLAHELYHAHLDARTNDPDYDHLDPGFGEQYGHPRGAVDFANEELGTRGL